MSAAVRVWVAHLADEGRWVTVCLTGACLHRPPVGEYDTERAARIARANHVRWHHDQRDRGAECPTCAQLVPPGLRRAADLPDIEHRPRALPGEIRLW